jgi:predicted dehydrogenase
MADARRLVEKNYAAKSASGKFQGCLETIDYRELLAHTDIEVVSIVTPDHWHGLNGVDAARAGKDIFLQKPLTWSIAEGRSLSDAVKKHGRVLQVGSQQRSDTRFRQACEVVRNGLIGRVHTVKIGFGLDPSTGVEPEMPVPGNLDYHRWLGPAPVVPYTEKRVHPAKGYSRPGWLRIQDYCHGMITGWGSHHMDIAHWGLGVDRSGPVSIEATAEFPETGLWNVHGKFRVTCLYRNGARVVVAGNEENKQGVEFIGDKGWVYVRRGHIDASNKSLLSWKPSGGDVRLYRSDNHKANFLDCVRSRKEPVTPVEIGHRSNSACVLGSLAMNLGRKLQWDPDRERFLDDDEANNLRARTMRAPWSI